MNILDQITESQVSEWMLARLSQLRASDHNVHSIMFYSVHYEGWEKPEFSVTMHGDKSCVISKPDTETAYKDLAVILYGDPAKRALDLRKEAEAILAKADELDERAKNPIF